LEDVEEEKKPVIECSMSYSLLDEDGREVAAGECNGTIDEERLTVFPKFGNVLPFELREIVGIETENYRITLPLVSRERVVLSNLGRCFEDFLRNLADLRNEMIIKDLLMNESVRKSDVEVDYVHYDETGNERGKGIGKVRLYETGLVAIPQKGNIVRVPYSDIAKVSEENHGVRIATESGEQLVFSRMGSEYDSFLKTLSDINDELQKKAISSLKTLFPGTDSVSLRKIASIMKEGKVARRIDIEAINRKLWSDLEKKIDSAGLNESYTFLKGLARQERVCIGFKRGLVGDLTGEYMWFLMPIYDVGKKDIGNAIAMETTEATGEESSGKATYFFRIASRKDYPNYRNLDDLDKGVDNFIKKINRCMLDINFRREPICLPDERLEEPNYLRYKIAVQVIPSLKLLRSRYIGRVIHASPEQWKSDVMDLLKFNLMTQDDSVKWKKQAKD